MTRDDVHSGRCLIDRERPRPVYGPAAKACQSHRDQLADMLDPNQQGQTFATPGEHPTPPSIPVLFALLDAEPGVSGDNITKPVFRSKPPGNLQVMAIRDPRTRIGGLGRDDERIGPWSAPSTLLRIAAALDVRDLEDRPVPVPRAVDELAQWLHARLDRLCAADWVPDAWDALRALHVQLRIEAWDPPPRSAGRCWQRVDNYGRQDSDGQWECGVPVYLPPQQPRGVDEPVRLPDIQCRGCKWVYTGVELWRLAGERGKRVAS